MEATGPLSDWKFVLKSEEYGYSIKEVA